MITLRPYQKQIAQRGIEVLRKYGIVYLVMEFRIGKTLTSLEIAKHYKSVLFVTKKIVIPSIEKDYKDAEHTYHLDVINYESLHKVKGKYDLLIIDEAHRLGGFPKPCKAARQLKEFKLPIIYLSGTPTPESWSQIFHQFWVSPYTPFEGNFYKWAKSFVNVKQRHLQHGIVNNYSDAKEDLIKKHINKYFISYTQKEAGFKSNIKEHTLYVDMPETIKKVVNILNKKLVCKGKHQTILADGNLQLMQKTHQLMGGTCIDDQGEIINISDFKARFIQDKFKGQKLAIFYKYKAEYWMLKKVFKEDLTRELDEFNNTSKHIALQMVNGREGISLKKADSLIFYSIDFSATTYWQARDRMTTQGREENNVYWIFTKGGIEDQIYKAVLKKKNFTTAHYDRKLFTGQNY